MRPLRKASGEELRLMRVPGESAGTQPGMWLQASQLYSTAIESSLSEDEVARPSSSRT